MATTSSRHLARLSVIVALIAVAVSGCGGGAKTVGTKPSTAVSTTTATNGLEHKSAAQVEAAAAAALKAARSVRVTGTGHSDGRLLQVDLRFQGTSSTGTIEMDGATLQITSIGTDTYVKADQRAWQVLGAPAAVQRLAGGRWVKLGGQQASSFGLTLGSLSAGLVQDESPLQPAVEQSTLDGHQVVVIRQQDSSQLYVANTGPAYPLPGVDKGKEPGRLDSTEYGTDFHISAPPDAVDLSG